uniref:Metalloendopeptidase n=1 Tax=Steinernema glaseri TaxID=37863 RepID=A0A1I7ZE19_9BILA
MTPLALLMFQHVYYTFTLLVPQRAETSAISAHLAISKWNELVQVQAALASSWSLQIESAPYCLRRCAKISYVDRGRMAPELTQRRFARGDSQSRPAAFSGDVFWSQGVSGLEAGRRIASAKCRIKSALALNLLRRLRHRSFRLFLPPGMESMSSGNETHFTIIENVSRTKFHRHRRQAIAGPMYNWPSSEIPFQIWGGDFNFQQLIRRGIRMWEEHTCLRFRENAQRHDGIRFVLENGESCFTEHIGHKVGFQDIIIGSECAEDYVVAHEIAHALGFWHTHQRPDREKFITINWNNVLEEATASFIPFRSMLQAFGIRQVSNQRLPYDYGSLMHYNAVAHAVKTSDYTIVPKELKYLTTMGTEKIAFLDAKIINDIYCPNICTGRQQLRCQGGGYPNPNNCNVCRCPEGLGGAQCDQLQPSTCGEEIRATGQWQTLSSPPGKTIHCYWRISVPEGSRVRFRLSDGEFPCTYGCQSYVEIKHKMDVRLTGFRSCCWRPKEATVSEGNQIFVIYHPNGKKAGFSLRSFANFHTVGHGLNGTAVAGDGVHGQEGAVADVVVLSVEHLPAEAADVVLRSVLHEARGVVGVVEPFLQLDDALDEAVFGFRSLADPVLAQGI